VANLILPYSFIPNTLAESSKVNADFNAIETFVETQLIHADGSTPFSTVPVGPATDPVSDNQLPRKRYVDGDFAMVQRIGFSLASSGSIQVPGGFTSVIARGLATSAAGITVSTTGVYECGFIVQFGSNASGSRGGGMRDNGSQLTGMGQVSSGDSVGGFGQGLSIERPYISLTAGDVLDLHVFQNSGVSLVTSMLMWVRSSR